MAMAGVKLDTQERMDRAVEEYWLLSTDQLATLLEIIRSTISRISQVGIN